MSKSKGDCQESSLPGWLLFLMVLQLANTSVTEPSRPGLGTQGV